MREEGFWAETLIDSRNLKWRKRICFKKREGIKISIDEKKETRKTKPI